MLVVLPIGTTAQGAVGDCGQFVGAKAVTFTPLLLLLLRRRRRRRRGAVRAVAVREDAHKRFTLASSVRYTSVYSTRIGHRCLTDVYLFVCLSVCLSGRDWND